ncbi:YaiY family protein [Pseudescherichia vulneris]|uniref:DUF2755 family protein n=1 Tax=Enterobacteriaceae TaxID=543 RepID=UPI000CDD530B|nr:MULTISPECIES: DUF2755 family protein [Enterobacteriaceae]POT98038.1 DUF2755 domain-containing protein [Escherichia sp. ESNIH1]WAH53920.1 YaiY family protein [Pseudescherichia vulneris]
MAEFMMSKPFANEKRRDASTPGNIAYAVFVLLCFWAGAQLLNALIHAPGVFENLMQMQESNRPRIDMGLGVGTIFGLVPFLVGSAVLGVIALLLRWRHY